MIYDANFTALTFEQFQETAQPLVAKYRAAMGRKDADGKTKTYDIVDARNELYAHCRAWAINKKRKALIEDFISASCYQ